MNLRITARRFKLPDDMKQYVEQKASKLDRYYDGIIKIDVILGWEKLTRFAELKIDVNSKQIVIKEISEDMRKSIDLALERAERQLKKYKSKIRKIEKDIINSA
jgi:putative sigma-54 modulation protein